jgi:O-methyltransferase domain/Dimerisation domain
MSRRGNAADDLLNLAGMRPKRDSTSLLSTAGLDPSHVMEVGTGFWPSKTLLSAVELDLFSVLGAESMSGEQVGARLALHPRAIDDFLDALVALGFLEREREGTSGRYRNSAEAAAFLDKQSPTYVGGFLELCNARLYGVWGELTDALRTGEPQSEVKLKPFFEEIYSDPAKLEQFMQAMSGLSRVDFDTLAERFDFGCYGTVCDVGGATGRLSMTLAGRYPHLRCTTYDQPVVAPIAERSIAAAGLSDRVTVASGDFFTEALPRADVITMSHILHDWNLDRKRQLISAAYDALPDGGAFIVVEHLIDDARRDNVFGLMMSLTMLLTFGDAFDFTGSDFAGWCREAGFGDIEIVPLTGLTSAGIAYK